MAWGFVQAGSNNTPGSPPQPTCAVTPTSNITTGNRIIVLVSAESGTAPPSSVTVADSAGNTYYQEATATFNNGGEFSMATLYSAPITAGGGTKPTITATAHPAGSNTIYATSISFAEYSGLATDAAAIADKTHTNVVSGSTTTSATTGTTAATTAANELVVATYNTDGYVTSSMTSTSSFTSRTQIINDSHHETALWDKDSGTSGSTETSNWTLGSASLYTAIIAVFKLAATSVNGSVTAVAATATAAAAAPVVTGSATVAGVAATGTASAAAPAVSGSATVTGVAATGTAAAVAPTVAATRNPTVTAVAATGTAAAAAPTVSADAAVTGVAAAGTASAAAPVVTGSADVTAVAASGSAAAVAPAASAGGSATVTAVVATATAAAAAPTVSAGVTVTAVAATGTAQAFPPVGSQPDPHIAFGQGLVALTGGGVTSVAMAGSSTGVSLSGSSSLFRLDSDGSGKVVTF